MTEPTGLLDSNGNEIKENSWIEVNDTYCKTRSPHYVFWDEEYLCWSTIRFCKSNNKLDWREELFRVKDREPTIIERPNWITDVRIAKRLKYYVKTYEDSSKNNPRQEKASEHGQVSGEDSNTLHQNS